MAKIKCDCFNAKFWEAKFRKLNMLDFGLVKLSVFFFALAIATYWPTLVQEKYLTIWIFLFVLAILKPVYEIWFKK